MCRRGRNPGGGTALTAYPHPIYPSFKLRSDSNVTVIRHQGARLDFSTLTDSARLLRLAVACPVCGRVPRLRVPDGRAERYDQDPPDAVVITYECHVRRCGTRYPITVQAFRGAS